MNLTLYPTKADMLDAIRFIESQLPITNPNELFPLLMTYHNTLMKELGEMECTVKGNPLEKTLKLHQPMSLAPELRKYVLYQEYPAVLLQDVLDVLEGNKVYVFRAANRLCIMDATQQYVLKKDAIEGVHFQLIEPIPTQSELNIG